MNVLALEHLFDDRVRSLDRQGDALRVEDRNLTSDTYREALTQAIYSRIPAHHGAMPDAVQELRATLWRTGADDDS